MQCIFYRVEFTSVATVFRLWLGTKLVDFAAALLVDRTLVGTGNFLSLWQIQFPSDEEMSEEMPSGWRDVSPCIMQPEVGRL